MVIFRIGCRAILKMRSLYELLVKYLKFWKHGPCCMVQAFKLGESSYQTSRVNILFNSENKTTGMTVTDSNSTFALR